MAPPKIPALAAVFFSHQRKSQNKWEGELPERSCHRHALGSTRAEGNAGLRLDLGTIAELRRQDADKFVGDAKGGQLATSASLMPPLAFALVLSNQC
jgi:hypothetical protein